MIETALENLAQTQISTPTSGPSKKSPAEAVADILELRKGVRLGGLKTRNLIHEGHKY